jgi:hypothetical protein
MVTTTLRNKLPTIDADTARSASLLSEATPLTFGQRVSNFFGRNER